MHFARVCIQPFTRFNTDGCEYPSGLTQALRQQLCSRGINLAFSVWSRTLGGWTASKSINFKKKNILHFLKDKGYIQSSCKQAIFKNGFSKLFARLHFTVNCYNPWDFAVWSHDWKCALHHFSACVHDLSFIKPSRTTLNPQNFGNQAVIVISFFSDLAFKMNL